MAALNAEVTRQAAMVAYIDDFKHGGRRLAALFRTVAIRSAEHRFIRETPAIASVRCAQS